MKAYLLSKQNGLKRFNFSNPKSDTANAIERDEKFYIWGHGNKGFDFYETNKAIESY